MPNLLFCSQTLPVNYTLKLLKAGDSWPPSLGPAIAAPMIDASDLILLIRPPLSDNLTSS
ncbi:MAG: hypothetical protein GDA56_26615 [Hormoscilla sp. GM7CHS1pb]|nr:hypothetical protein [Hormoscilla sp. GM7CHS1pb]